MTRTLPPAYTARMVHRVTRVDQYGWTYGPGGKRRHRVGGLYKTSKCDYCGADVVDRAEVAEDELPAACEVCREKSKPKEPR